MKIKFRRIVSVIIAILFTFSLTACLGSKETKSINVYFKKSETNELTIEKVKYTGSQNTVDMAIFALNKLIEGSDNPECVKTFPEGTSVLSLTVKDEVANIDFSEEFSTSKGIDELLARFSVIRTLCDIPGISKISITVKGATLVSNSTGNEVGILSKKDVVLDVDTVNPDRVKTTVTVYFATANENELKAETRRIETQDTISIEKTIVTELIKGPSSPELNPVIPSGTRILNIETKDSVCYVNLSQEFISKFSGNTGTMAVFSIVNSLCCLENVQSVQFLIEGEKGAKLGDYVFDEPIEPNLNIVQKQ